MADWSYARNGLRRRCPRCRERGVFASFFELEPACPRCGLTFEREEGYWVGAMAIDLAVTEGLFGLLFVGGILLTWPEVPWTLLLVAGLAVNAIVPVVAYPWSKTAWMGLHLSFSPPAEDSPASGDPSRSGGSE